MKKLFLFLLSLILYACNAPPPAKTLEPPTIEMAELTVYFLDEAKFAVGQESYEVGVIREIHPDAFLPRLALQAYFDGPTEEESAQGLVLVLSGCTGFSDFRIEDRVAHVYLTGPCTSGGSTYTIAGPIMKTLKKFDEIEFVKIYDAEGITEDPDGRSDSIPSVLEP
jgi:hypothetical protein